jgi:hypothetical protein
MLGHAIEVLDDAGLCIGEGRLGETAWPGTSALYVADVELVASGAEGMNLWSAKFAASESGFPHAQAAATFTFRTTRPPEYRVTVTVMDKVTQTPLENVDARQGAYRASTDAQGVARLELPSGVYDLDAWKTGYQTAPTVVDVARDQIVQLEAVFSPEQDPDDSHVWM